MNIIQPCQSARLRINPVITEKLCRLRACHGLNILYGSVDGERCDPFVSRPVAMIILNVRRFAW